MDIQRISLVLTISLTTCLTVLCHTPPNPNPTVSSKHATRDRLKGVVSPKYLIARRLVLVSFCAYHALVVLFYPSTPTSTTFTTVTTICPRYENLNPDFFTWSLRSGLSLAMIFIFTSIRLLAFAQLGSSFTFALGPPVALTTTGMYKWVQHPSYIANAVLIAFNILLFFQPSGVMGCWISEDAVKSVWWSVIGWGFAATSCFAGWIRVKDEEKMLKEKFGKEWDVWHRQTKRFIPWVF
jgi:protein-S-isoprenylcysteine O-methyltransferase Ste14